MCVVGYHKDHTGGTKWNEQIEPGIGRDGDIAEGQAN